MIFGRRACWRAARLQLIPAALRHKSNSQTRQKLLQQVVWEFYQGSLYIISASHSHTHTHWHRCSLNQTFSTLINAAIGSSLWLKELCILLPLEFQPPEIFFLIFVYLRRRFIFVRAEHCDSIRAVMAACVKLCLYNPIKKEDFITQSTFRDEVGGRCHGEEPHLFMDG